ncbi:MAG: ATP-binding protein [Gammaproteobacteria bacterium]|nr:ATP-binding protein [Gammaproteobacteria bacterium]
MRLAVTDTGSGMDVNTKSRIWEPFFTTKAQGSGTGLGLPSVYGVVTQSGGDVTVDSEPGQGTTFKIFLPAVEDTSSTPHPSKAESGKSSLPLAIGTILVCDDQAQIRDVVARILERAGVPGPERRMRARRRLN